MAIRRREISVHAPSVHHLHVALANGNLRGRIAAATKKLLVLTIRFNDATNYKPVL